MEIKTTAHVDSHRVNSEYLCMVVSWNGDANFRCRSDGSHDWVPTDAEMVELIVEGIKTSPTLWAKITERIKPASYVHEFLSR